jgi:hypothetical protein
MMTERRHVVLSLIAPALVVATLIAVSPFVRASLAVASAFAFFGAAIVAVLGVSLGARKSLRGRTVLAVDCLAAVTLATLAVLHVRNPYLSAIVDAALIAFAWATGGAIGQRVEHPAHLLPAAAVAAAADVASVASSWGPSNAIASSERALSVLAISFPVLGTRSVAPALGVGDLIFIALALGVARQHGLPYRRITMLALVGVVIAGVASAFLERAVPALPAIGLMIVAFVPAARAVRRRDRTVTTMAIGISAIVVVATIVGLRR